MRGPEQTWGQDERAPHRTKREAESPLNKAGECADRPGTPGGLPFTGPLGTGTDLEWEGTPPGALRAGSGRVAQGPPITAGLGSGSAGQGTAPGDKEVQGIADGRLPKGTLGTPPRSRRDAPAMLAWTLRAACRGHAPVWGKQVPEHLGSASMESEERANGENRHQKWLRGKKINRIDQRKRGGANF